MNQNTNEITVKIDGQTLYYGPNEKIAFTAFASGVDAIRETLLDLMAGGVDDNASKTVELIAEGKHITYMFKLEDYINEK